MNPKVSLTNEQRKLYSEKVLDFAHLAFGGLVIGQFFSGYAFSLPLAILGIVLLVFLYWLSYTLTKKRRK